MSSEPLSSEPLVLLVGAEYAGCRLDVFLAKTFATHSRVNLRKAINAGGVQVDGRRVKAAHKLHAGEVVSIRLPEILRQAPTPENIPLEILYEDDWLAAINKPPGMVTHPAKGHWSGTLTSALQFHFDRLSSAGGPTRPGIVHRLDRDTSGVLVVAKNDRAHFELADQFERRTVEKEYWAIVVGRPDRDRDAIDLPIGMHPYQREKMAVRRDHPTSRPAQSVYEVAERFDGFALVHVWPKSGRTHQIRVHLTAAGYPVLCDRLYSGRAQITRGEIRRQPEDGDILLARQALHARRLKLKHPSTGAVLKFEAPLPADLVRVLEELRASRGLDGIQTRP